MWDRPSSIVCSENISRHDERLLDYWKINPDRYPDVVVFESCYGDIAQEGENSFIWNWLMEDFQPAERKDYPYITVFTR